MLTTFRDDGAGGADIQKVYSVPGGNGTPTGSRVFGHAVQGPGDRPYHWDHLAGAYDC